MTGRTPSSCSATTWSACRSCATVAGKINVLSGFYKLAKFDRRIVDNPCDGLRRPTVPNESTREHLNRLEMLKLMDAAERIGDYESALITVFCLTGARVGEVCALDAEHVRWQGHYRTLKIRREKGNVSGDVPITPRLSQALDHHLGNRKTGPLFVKRNGERLDRKAAARVIARCCRAAGITKNITPHSLRHSFITAARAAGATNRDLVDSMGYSDDRPLSRYDRERGLLGRHATWNVAAAIEAA